MDENKDKPNFSGCKLNVEERPSVDARFSSKITIKGHLYVDGRLREMSWEEEGEEEEGSTEEEDNCSSISMSTVF